MTMSNFKYFHNSGEKYNTIISRVFLPHTIIIFVLIFFLILGTHGSSLAIQDFHADIIFINGNVVTVNETFSRAQALAIWKGKIIAVGSNSDVMPLKGLKTRVVDLKGKTILPGLQDSHIHFLSLGSELHNEAELTMARSAEEIIEAVKELKQRFNPAPGEWIQGNRWDQYKYPEMFTRWQLDEIAPDNPVRLSRVYRGVAVNTKVFNLMGIKDEEPSTWPNWWLKDPSDFTFEDKIYRAPRKLSINGEIK